jgi:hypothetical protein
MTTRTFNGRWPVDAISRASCAHRPECQGFRRKPSWDQIAKIYGEVFVGAATRATAFHLITVATRGYEDALRRCCSLGGELRGRI